MRDRGGGVGGRGRRKNKKKTDGWRKTVRGDYQESKSEMRREGQGGERERGGGKKGGGEEGDRERAERA